MISSTAEIPISLIQIAVDSTDSPVRSLRQSNDIIFLTGYCLRGEQIEGLDVVRVLNDEEAFKHAILGKLTAIVGHCELLELEEEEQHPACQERLAKIKSLALETSVVILRYRTPKTDGGE